MNEKRPMPDAKAPILGGNPIVFEGRTLLCPFSDPVKVAAWLKEWRSNPAVRLAEMHSRLAYLKDQARRVAGNSERRG